MNLEDDILIEKYLKGELSSEEQDTFTERLNSDAEFKAQFELEKRLFESIDDDDWSYVRDENNAEIDAYKEILTHDDDIKHLKKTLSEFKVDASPRRTLKITSWVIYAAAASIALFFAINSIFNSQLSNEELYYEYLNTEDLPSFVTRGDDTDTMAVKAQQQFESKNYEEALQLFSGIETNSAKLYLYRGVSQMELGKFSEAEETFKTLIDSEFLDAPKGKWYLALLYLKMDKVDDAKTILNEIVEKSLYNNEQAKALLGDL